MKKNLPFKRPFKGKGEIIAARDAAYAAMISIELEMAQLIKEYELAFHRPSVKTARAVTLVNQYSSRGKHMWHKTYYSRLNWRASKAVMGTQRYTRLFTSEVGIKLMARMPAGMQQALEDFEFKRLDMNYRMSIAYFQWNKAKAFLTDYEAAELKVIGL
ncbi:MAG: hypothetical protein V3W04_13760 [Gammaproteobacteria bacterium]